MKIEDYIKGLTGEFFSALPLRQSGTDVVCLMQYMQSIKINAIGFQNLHPDLQKNKDFQRAVNIAAYLGEFEVDDKVWKREILKATNLLNKVEELYKGGDEDA